jgi:hypothetical protein
MSKQDTAIMPIELSNKINRWNFDNSVIKMRELGKQWSKITAQVARELYFAKEFLLNQKGQRRDPDAPDYILYTWNDYCEAIGLDRQVADYWIKKFIPREISDTGKDILLIKAPMKTETTREDRALIQARINEVLRTGSRPSDWTDEEETELQRQMENARLAEKVEKYNSPTYFKANDYFADALRHSKDITNFKLENSVQIQAQYKVFKYIEEYLNAFENTETQARAAFNIALKTRNLANEKAEKNFQLKNAQIKEGYRNDG